MKDLDYAYCVARIRAREKHLLTKQQLEALCQKKSYAEAVDELKEIGWIEKDGGIADFISYQNQQTWELLSECVPDKNALEVLCVLNDFFNIKTAVKCLISGADPYAYYVNPTSLNLTQLTEKVKNHDFKALGTKKDECAAKAFEMAGFSENGQLAEIIIDSAALELLRIYGAEKKNSLTGEICDFLCDTANIKIALRINAIKRNKDFAAFAISPAVHVSSEQLIRLSCEATDELYEYLLKTPYAQGVELYKKGSTHYDKWCDDSVMTIASKAKFTAFGFDPVCAYFYAKQNEIKNVRIILSALQAGYSSDTIEERMRALYV